MASALASLSDHPNILKRLFCNRKQTVNDAGVYCIRLFLRGKPWMLTIDDDIAFDNTTDKLYFSKANNNVIWPVLLEKAFAKMKGTYSFIDSKSAVTGLRALTGSPVFTYTFAGTKLSSEDIFKVIKSALDKRYMANMVTYEGKQGELNGCGLPMSQSFQIVSTFSLDNNLMTMLRYPKGTDISNYNRRWNHRDTKMWIQSYIDQVPLGINPLTAWKKGYLFIESRDLFTCFKEVSIAHNRDGEGYSNNWYDVENDLGGKTDFNLRVPARDGDLYFSVESYYPSMYPISCTDYQLPSV